MKRIILSACSLMLFTYVNAQEDRTNPGSTRHDNRQDGTGRIGYDNKPAEGRGQLIEIMEGIEKQGRPEPPENTPTPEPTNSPEPPHAPPAVPVRDPGDRIDRSRH